MLKHATVKSSGQTARHSLKRWSGPKTQNPWTASQTTEKGNDNPHAPSSVFHGKRLPKLAAPSSGVWIGVLSGLHGLMFPGKPGPCLDYYPPNRPQGVILRPPGSGGRVTEPASGCTAKPCMD